MLKSCFRNLVLLSAIYATLFESISVKAVFLNKSKEQEQDDKQYSLLANDHHEASSSFESSLREEGTTLGAADEYFSDITACDGLAGTSFSSSSSSNTQETKNQKEGTFSKLFSKSNNNNHPQKEAMSFIHYKTMYITWEVYEACHLNPKKLPNLENLYVKLSKRWEDISWTENQVMDNFFKFRNLKKADVVDSDGMTVLMQSIFQNWNMLFATAAAFSPDINTRKQNGATALYGACYFNDVEKFKTLLDMGANVHVVNNQGYSPLLLSAYFKRHEILKILVDLKDVDVNVDKELNGMTALMIAARNADVKSIQILVDAGAKVDMQVNLGYDATYYAAESGYLDVVRYLRTLAYRQTPDHV